jgi:glycosyltransferase involved in cell wall biosynthesis
VDPEFSVIVPTRGDSAHLRAALGSALAAGDDLEVLLVHDRRPGEPDLALASGDDPRVRCIVSEETGPAAARNAGLSNARGRLVALLDDDDLWLPHHLERARRLLERDPGALLVACDAYLFVDPTDDGSGHPPDDLSALPRFAPDRPDGLLTLRDLLLANPILTPTVVLVRDRMAADARFRGDLRVMEDYDLWLRLARRHRLLFDARPGVVVRRRASSASRDRRAMAEDSIRVLEREWAVGIPPATLTRGEVRHRMGRLWHDLAYACLLDGDPPASRRAARRAMAHLPLLLKNYMYLLASLLPARTRGALLAAAARRRGDGSGGGTPTA